MEILENDFIKLQVNERGAELTSCFDKQSQTEYMWNGDAAFWGKHSPVLFPIVGTLKENTYYYDNRAFSLGRHGFARDMVFKVASRENNSLAFSIAADASTLKLFPFQFRFDIIYHLFERTLEVTYRVFNTGATDLYFSVGAHPAFGIPFSADAVYEDYFLEFEHAEEGQRWPISAEGLIEKEPIPVFKGTRLPLSKQLFEKDALVFKQLSSSAVTLASHTNKRGLTMQFPGFPFLGLWAAKGADFVCIEPWCGIADAVDSNQQLVQKEGINQLHSAEKFERSWTLTVF
ncbi:MAG: aldose 1-epimerase family protein [Chitinophagaceae bacterium]|nr:MAG: aldose 1-epimerase family protein [Chitinophagaceae bacterium]